MAGVLLVIANFDLKEILGSASAAIGVIIVGAIFRSFLSGKYAGLLGRYSQFTGEYRSLPHIAVWKWVGSAGLFLGLGCMA